ncbi:hypothetical protein COLO4_36917 [Corchorus olitorius]|uniref:Uncharacterized protein n=1 Tax=Corchorus olitorius TaxID=93759 RepID=A0A1R3G498_9ROSI|nr:hypothetical protein COLO4_36917 [Corchorus olitorius]
MNRDELMMKQVSRGQSIFAGWHRAYPFVSYKWNSSLGLLTWPTKVVSPVKQNADMACTDRLGVLSMPLMGSHVKNVVVEMMTLPKDEFNDVYVCDCDMVFSV